MKTIKLFILGAIALLFLTTACIDDFTIRGNGIAATEGRITQNFNKVKSSGAFDVHITNGDEQEVVIIAEENLLQYIETFASNNQLSIDIKGMHNVKNRLPMASLHNNSKSGKYKTKRFWDNYHGLFYTGPFEHFHFRVRAY